MSQEFVYYTLLPWCVRIEQAMMRSLLSAEDRKHIEIRFNLDGLLRGSYESRMRGYQTAVNTGIFSVNDCRKLENMDLLTPEDGGDTHMVQGAMIPLSMVGAAYTKQADNKTE